MRHNYHCMISAYLPSFGLKRTDPAHGKENDQSYKAGEDSPIDLEARSS